MSVGKSALGLPASTGARNPPARHPHPVVRSLDLESRCLLVLVDLVADTWPFFVPRLAYAIGEHTVEGGAGEGTYEIETWREGDAARGPKGDEKPT